MMESTKKKSSFWQNQSLIFAIYLPLLLSKLLMSMDNTTINAFLSRLNDSALCIAAHGGIVLPVAQMAEAPICMLISTSIALNSDRKNYHRVRKLATVLIAGALCVQILICLPPVFKFLMFTLLKIPEELVPYVRMGLLFMIPYSSAIGCRRFNQGILIRFGRTSHVTVGTIIRFSVLFAAFTISYLLREHIPATMITSISLISAVLCECFYITYWGHRTARECLTSDDPEIPLISWKELLRFIMPLSLTTCVTEVWGFAGSAAINRMPASMLSLSVWPVVSGVLNLFKSFGTTLNETSISVLQQDRLKSGIRSFMLLVTAFSLILFVLVSIPPANGLVFGKLFQLSDDVAGTCRSVFPLFFPILIVVGFINYLQARKIVQKKTSVIFESLLVYIAIILTGFVIGIKTQKWDGIYVMILSMDAAYIGQALWLFFR